MAEITKLRLKQNEHNESQAQKAIAQSMNSYQVPYKVKILLTHPIFPI